MQEDTKPPGWGQYVLAMILGILAFAMGGISLWMNAVFGLKSGLIMAAIFIGSDSAKIVLPMIAPAIENALVKRKIRLTYFVAVGLSLMAATAYLLETQATNLLDNQARTAALADARTDAERLRNELATIREQRSPDALKAEIEAHKQHKRWGATKECTEATVTESRLYCQAYNQLKADLANAERRDRLDVQLAD